MTTTSAASTVHVRRGRRATAMARWACACFAAAAPAVLTAPLPAQVVGVTGLVRPSQPGLPFAGAAITRLDDGSTVCAAPDGRFRVEVPRGDTARLAIRPVGFGGYEVVVQPADGDVSLPFPEHVVVLRGVEVTVFAGPPAPGGFSGRVDGSDIDRVPAASVEASLQGRVPGATFTSLSGAPGGGFRLDIRGIRTILGDSEPLVVLDGMPLANVRIASGTEVVLGTDASQSDVANRLADVNPADVERVDVIRGGMGTLRYGPKAANGVIDIRTRRGTVTDGNPPIDRSLGCFLPVG